MASFLIELGFPVNNQNYLGNTAMHYASSLKNWKIVELLLIAKADETILNNNGKTAWEISE